MKVKASEVDDDPMIAKPTERELCIEYVERELRPRFRLLIPQLEGKTRPFVVDALHLALTSVMAAIDSKVRSVKKIDFGGLLRDIRRHAGFILFSSEMAPEFTEVLTRVLKFSFVLFESSSLEDSVHSSSPESRRRLQLLDKISTSIELLVDVDGLNVSGKIIKEAFRCASTACAKELSRRTCVNCCAQSPLESVNQSVGNIESLTDWATRIHLSEHFNALLPDLMTCIEKTVVRELTTQIFNLVIVEYPASGDVIDNLRFCMENNDGYGRTELANTLAEEVQRRLLHVGVGTTDILQGYASAVECLRRLDPTCVIMQRICSIIRHYIKQRPDTVRCIITYITGEKREELGEQLTRRRTAFLDEEFDGINDELIPCGADDDTSEERWRKWMPDPPDAIPGQSRRFRQNADVFDMLVSVYGSKELFVKEYRLLLAERLTRSWNRDPHFEMRYLELLKLRFSDGELQQCEVMLKDMHDSEKMDGFVHSSLSFPISARIISSFFWPKVENETFKLPEEMQKGLGEYERAFETHKASRKLNWLTGVGCMQIDIKLDGVAATLTVSPAHAVLLALFTQKESWSVDEICATLEMEKRSVKKRLEWWHNSGILCIASKANASDSETWCLGSGTSKMDRLRSETEVEEEGSDDELAEDTAAIDALEQYWTYTRNYLANSDPIRAERLHNLYKMFGSPGQQGPSLETVIAFLQKKVKMNLLSCTNGFYKVVKEVQAH